MNCRKEIFYKLKENIHFNKRRRRRDKTKRVMVSLSCLSTGTTKSKHQTSWEVRAGQTTGQYNDSNIKARL